MKLDSLSLRYCGCLPIMQSKQLMSNQQALSRQMTAEEVSEIVGMLNEQIPEATTVARQLSIENASAEGSVHKSGIASEAESEGSAQRRLRTLLEILNSIEVSRMGLFFHNSTGKKVFVAYAYAWPACPDGGDWAKKGWYTNHARWNSASTLGCCGWQKVFFFAETDDRLVQWAGPFVTNVPVNAFDCVGTRQVPMDAILGMRKIMVSQGITHHTVNLT